MLLDTYKFYTKVRTNINITLGTKLSCLDLTPEQNEMFSTVKVNILASSKKLILFNNINFFLTNLY